MSILINLNILIASFFLHVISLGMCVSSGLYVVEIVDEFSVNTNVASSIVSLQIGIAFLIACPLSNILTEKWSHSFCIVIGSMCFFFGLFISSFSPNIYIFAIFFGLLSGFGTGLIYCPCFGVIAISFSQPAPALKENSKILKFFNLSRSSALAILVAGTGVGTLIFSTLLYYLIEFYCWYGALLILSAIALNCLPLCFVIKYSMQKCYNKDNFASTIKTIENVLNPQRKIFNKNKINEKLSETTKNNPNFDKNTQVISIRDCNILNSNIRQYSDNEMKHNNDSTYDSIICDNKESHIKNSEFNVPNNYINLTIEDCDINIMQNNKILIIEDENTKSDFNNIIFNNKHNINEFPDNSKTGSNKSVNNILRKQDSIDADTKKKICSKWFCNVRFFMYIINGFLLSLGMSAVVILIADFGERAGLKKSEAASLLTAFGLSSTIGRFLVAAMFNLFGDKIPAIFVYSMSILMSTIAIAVLPFLVDLEKKYVFMSTMCLFIGLGQAGQGSSGPVVAVDMFGPKLLQKVYASVLCACGLGSLLGGPIGASVMEACSSYMPSFLLLSTITLLSLIVMIPVIIQGFRICMKKQSL